MEHFQIKQSLTNALNILFEAGLPRYFVKTIPKRIVLFSLQLFSVIPTFFIMSDNPSRLSLDFKTDCLFLDVDGTLLDIAPHPDAVVVGQDGLIVRLPGDSKAIELSHLD